MEDLLSELPLLQVGLVELELEVVLELLGLPRHLVRDRG